MVLTVLVELAISWLPRASAGPWISAWMMGTALRSAGRAGDVIVVHGPGESSASRLGPGCLIVLLSMQVHPPPVLMEMPGYVRLATIRPRRRAEVRRDGGLVSGDLYGKK